MLTQPELNAQLISLLQDWISKSDIRQLRHWCLNEKAVLTDCEKVLLPLISESEIDAFSKQKQKITQELFQNQSRQDDARLSQLNQSIQSMETELDDIARKETNLNGEYQNQLLLGTLMSNPRYNFTWDYDPHYYGYWRQPYNPSYNNGINFSTNWNLINIEQQRTALNNRRQTIRRHLSSMREEQRAIQTRTNHRVMHFDSQLQLTASNQLKLKRSLEQKRHELGVNARQLREWLEQHTYQIFLNVVRGHANSTSNVYLRNLIFQVISLKEQRTNLQQSYQQTKLRVEQIESELKKLDLTRIDIESLRKELFRSIEHTQQKQKEAKSSLPALKQQFKQAQNKRQQTNHASFITLGVTSITAAVSVSIMLFAPYSFLLVYALAIPLLVTACVFALTAAIFSLVRYIQEKRCNSQLQECENTIQNEALAEQEYIKQYDKTYRDGAEVHKSNEQLSPQLLEAQQKLNYQESQLQINARQLEALGSGTYSDYLDGPLYNLSIFTPPETSSAPPYMYDNNTQPSSP